MEKIYFITGASGVGKTSLVTSLKAKYKDEKDWEFLHYDSIGVPTQTEMIDRYGSIQNWQKVKTHEWIGRMINEYSDKKVIIFEGQVNLQFIKDGFLQNNFSSYETILIDCNEKTMAKRLLGCRNQPELFNEDMKNWLVYLRNQAKNLGILAIDTSNKTKDEVVREFEKLLNSDCN